MFLSLPLFRDSACLCMVVLEAKSVTRIYAEITQKLNRLISNDLCIVVNLSVKQSIRHISNSGTTNQQKIQQKEFETKNSCESLETIYRYILCKRARATETPI